MLYGLAYIQGNVPKLISHSQFKRNPSYWEKCSIVSQQPSKEIKINEKYLLYKNE